MNKVILMGNIANDLVLEHSANNTPFLRFSVATSRKLKNKKTGQFESETQFHSCVAFEKIAVVIEQFAKKGHKIMVEGWLKNEKWVDKTTGENKYKTVIMVDNVEFAQKKEQTENQGLASHIDDDLPF